MKEPVKNEIKRLSDRLDILRHRAASYLESGDAEKLGEAVREQETIEAELAKLRETREQTLSKEAQKLQSMPFKRAITKKEQADMGTLKKKVRGIVVVHPMTALGREMGLKEMTGFARTEF